MRWTWPLLAFSLACQPPGDRGPELVTDWRLAGHGELEEAPGEIGPVAVLVESETTLRGCVDPGPEADTSQWQGALVVEGTGAEPEWAAPERRAGSVLCFAAPITDTTSIDTDSIGTDSPDLSSPDMARREVPACLQLVDRFTGVEQQLPCRRIRVLESPDDWRSIDAELGQQLRAGTSAEWRDFVAALDGLRDRARAAGYLMLAHRIELITAYYLERDGGDDGEREAWQRLAAEPGWLSRPGAESLAAQTALERAKILKRGGRVREAWEEVERAAVAYRSIGDSRTLSAVLVEAEILAGLGAYREATERLGAGLTDCARAPCHEVLVSATRSSFSWWLAQLPDASAEELEEAARSLEPYLASDSTGVDALELANAAMNLALLEVRLGRDPRPTLGRIREIVAERGGARAELLAEWAELVEADFELAVQPAAALARAERTAGTTASPEIAAWAWSTMGRARRLEGDLPGATLAFERALVFHEHATRSAVGGGIPLGPGRRAEDFFRAARVEVERGRHGEAWSTLARVDVLGASGRESIDCDPAGRTERQARRRDLLAELVVLERPASRARREQRLPVRRAIMEELQELVRAEDRCGAAASPVDADFRAFAVDDEILLLERSGSGVELARRTPLPRGETRAILARLARSGGEPLDDARWIEEISLLASALVPPRLDELGDVTVFALHGALQAVPLGALPVTSSEAPANGARWLADVTTVVVSSGIARPGGGADVRSPDPGLLFVVDPLGDLAGAKRLAPEVRSLFPEAVILEGAAATLAATARELQAASWLHIGAHGVYDPAFPDLSSLRLADGDLRGFDLAAAAGGLAGANLSACHSGRWEPTAGSGRHGLGGLMSRHGVPWVISSRSALADDVARAFNQLFYRELAAGGSVVGAYAAATRAVRDAFPASQWSALLLLGAPLGTELSHERGDK